jgi:hypothetical protein
MILNSPYISGSSTITGNLTVLGSISGSTNSAISASYATTASYADTFTVDGTLTAQKLVVQTITSSIVYSSGSNVFGSSSTDTQTFTGSVNITGSLSTTGSSTFSGTVTAANINVTSNTIPANGMYLSVANTLNFATNSGNRMTIGTTGAITMTSTLSLGNYLQLTTANTFIYGGTTVGSIQYGNSTSSTHLKTYGATHATLANVIQLTNNSVVSLTLAASGAATFASSATATAFIPSAATIPTNGMYLSATNTLDFATNSTNRLTITSGGNVGIGTTSPNGPLDVVGPNYGGLYTLSLVDTAAVAANIGGGIYFGGNYTGTTKTGWAGILGRKDNATDGQYGGYMAFETRTHGSAPAERMRITSGGDVQINATGTALAKLHIAGALNSNMLLLRSNNDLSANINFTSTSPGGSTDNYSINHTIVHGGSGGYQIEHNVTSRWIRMIAGTGGVELAGAATSWASISDVRQKDILETGIPNAINKIKTIDAIFYKYKSEEFLKEGEEILELVKKGIPTKIKQRRIGLIAQQIQEVLPEAVNYNEDEDIYRLSYTEVIPLLVEAIKEQQAQIEELKSLIN